MGTESLQLGLAGRHQGQTGWIVGSGPSLLQLTAVGPGPVIALNYAIVQLRALGLANPVYSLQQDGCLVEPIEPETLLLSVDQGARCFKDYPNRMVLDVRADLGVPLPSMSTPIAVRIAQLMGAAELVMVGHDAYVLGDPRCVDAAGAMTDESRSFPGYVQGAEIANQLAAEAGLPIRWL